MAAGSYDSCGPEWPTNGGVVWLCRLLRLFPNRYGQFLSIVPEMKSPEKWSGLLFNESDCFVLRVFVACCRFGSLNQI